MDRIVYNTILIAGTILLLASLLYAFLTSKTFSKMLHFSAGPGVHKTIAIRKYWV